LRDDSRLRRGIATRAASAAIIARAVDQVGRPPPCIVAIADDDPADNSSTGCIRWALFCFLVASEGFGFGGFDAATHGRPVTPWVAAGQPTILGPIGVAACSPDGYRREPFPI
jgi:hypothetical protein